MPPPIESEGPLTFSSPFATAQELRQGAAAAAHHPQQPPSGEPRPPGVLRTGSGLASGAPGSGALGEQPARLRRTVSWSDVENRAPLAQVVEYEPSENHSTHSEDEWASHSSGCICCIQ